MSRKLGTSYDNTRELASALDDAMPDRRWRIILETLHITGVADASQLQQATRLARDTLRRTLDHLANIFLGDAPLIQKLDHTIPQPGRTNRPPSIYRLAGGAARLLSIDGPEVRACELKEDIPIAHALCMLSVHLVAKREGIEIYTDEELPFDDRLLRPDHRIVVPGGHWLIMEVEQEAHTNLLRRILESLSNHQAFFKSSASESYLREVRVLFNLKGGKDVKRALDIWEAAVRELFKQAGEELVFRFSAIPLEMFLERPEWGVMLSKRWQQITGNVEPSPMAKDEEGSTYSALSRPRRALSEDVTELEALSQMLAEEDDPNEADLNIFRLAKTIYSASYGRDNFISQVSRPSRSLHLFNKYLDMHPDLRTKLRVALHHNRGRVVWSQPNVLHRMEIVMRAFMSYHGFRTEGLLRVGATTQPENFGDTYGVYVRMHFRMADDWDEDRLMLQAMEWMLWALFAYADDLKLGRPEFW